MRLFTIALSIFFTGMQSLLQAQPAGEDTILIEWSKQKVPQIRNISLSIYRHKSCIYQKELINNGHFSYQTKLDPNDTLYILLSMGDSLTGKAVILNQSSKRPISVFIPLQRNVTLLEEIIITPPPMYRQGNTTYFKADAFLQKQDQTLRDLINRLPYFRLEEDGRLTYKGKAIPSIRIQGEEIFADQIQLLTTRIPSRVIKSLEIQEHTLFDSTITDTQRKGEVSLNLSLKKEYLHRPWGDTKAGVGFDPKPFYTGETAFFALWNHIKGAWFGNIQTDGQTADQTELLQQKTPNLLHLLPWAEASFSLLKPAVLDNRYLIRNKLIHQRFQFNHTIKPNHHFSWEGRYLQDKGEQVSELFTRRVAENTVHIQQWRNVQSWSPQLLTIGLKYKYQNKRKESFFFNIRWGREANDRTEKNLILENEQAAGHQHQNTLRLSTLFLQTEYVCSKKEYKTQKIQLQTEWSGLERSYEGVVMQSGSFLTIPDSLPIIYQQALAHQLFRSRIRIETSNKRIHTRSPLQWEFEWMDLRIESPFYLKPTQSIILLKDLSGEGSYKSGQLTVTEVMEKRKKNVLFKLSGQTGLSVVVLNDNKRYTSGGKIIPQLRLIAECEYSPRKAGIWRSSFLFFRGRRDLMQLPQVPMPRKALQFLQVTAPSTIESFAYWNTSYWSNISQTIRSELDASIEYRFISMLTQTEISGSYTHTRIRYISKPSENVYFAIRLYWLKNPDILTIKGGLRFDIRRDYLSIASQTEKLTVYTQTGECSVEWHPFPKWTMKGQIQLIRNMAGEPSQQRRQTFTANIQYFHTLSLHTNVSPKCQIEYNMQQFGNLYSVKAQNNNTLACFKLHWLLHQRCRIQLISDNLFNSRRIYLQHENLGYVQSSLSVSLIERRFSATIQWQF